MADERERRVKLLALKDAVRAFFEVTNVVDGTRGWSSAFRAVRANDYMADSFLVELRALVDFIEVEFDPHFGKVQYDSQQQTTEELPGVGGYVHTPSIKSVSQAIHAAKTEILSGRLPGVRVTGGKTPTIATKAPPVAARPAPVAAKPAPVAARPAPVAAKPAPVAARPPAPPAKRPVAPPPPVKRPVAPPPPPPRRNQFAESGTHVDGPSQYEHEEATDATGRMLMRPIHHPSPPKKKK